MKSAFSFRPLLLVPVAFILLISVGGASHIAHAQSTSDLTLVHNFGTHQVDLAPLITPVPGFAFPNEHFVDRHVVSDESILMAQVQHSLVPGGDSLLILTSIDGAHGTVDVTAFYTAGSGTTSHTVTVLVGPPPTPPIAENFTVTIHHDNPSPVRIVDHISDVNVPTQTLTVEILEHSPITNLLIVSGGSVTDGRYILSADNIVNVRHHSASPNNAETATFSYNVTNDAGSSIGMVTVEIPAAPTPPVANSFLADIHHSNPSFINIRAMTHDGNHPSLPLSIMIDSVRDVEIVGGLVESVTYPATSGMLAPGSDLLVQSTVYDGSATSGEVRYTATNSFGLTTTNVLIDVEIPVVPQSEYSFELVESGTTYTTDEEVPLVIQLSDFVNARPPILIESATFTNTPGGTGSDALSIDATARTLTFTPIMGFVGITSIPLYAEYPAGTVSGPIAIPVDVISQFPTAPNIVLTTPPGLYIDPITIDFSEHVSDAQSTFDALSITFGITNVGTPTVYISDGVASAGPTLTNGVHTLTGSNLTLVSDEPVPGGSYNYEYMVTDDDGNSESAIVTLQIPEYVEGLTFPDQTYILNEAGDFTRMINYKFNPPLGPDDRENFVILFKMTEPEPDGVLSAQTPEELERLIAARQDRTPDLVISARGVNVNVTESNNAGNFTYDLDEGVRQDTFEIRVTAEKIGDAIFDVVPAVNFQCFRDHDTLGPFRQNCERHSATIESHSTTATITIINNFSSSDSSDPAWKKKPTFGESYLTGKKAVDCGYSMDNQCRDVLSYHVDYEREVIQTNSEHDFALKAYAQNGLRAMSLGFGVLSVGSPLNSAEALISVDLIRNYTEDSTYTISKVTYQNENDVIGEDAIISINKAKCLPEHTYEACIQLNIDGVQFREQMYQEPFLIQALDSKRYSTINYMNEGLLIQGTSMNEAPMVEKPVPRSANQHDDISLVLIRTDKLADVWTDQFGHTWTKNGFGTWSYVVGPAVTVSPVCGDEDKRHCNAFREKMASHTQDMKEMLNEAYPGIYAEEEFADLADPITITYNDMDSRTAFLIKHGLLESMRGTQ